MPRMKVAALLIVVVMSPLHAHQGTPIATSPLGDKPTLFDALFETAQARKDLAFLSSALDDDVRFTLATGARWNKAQALAAVPTLDFISRTVDDVEVERHGDITETTGHLTIKTNGTDPTNPSRRVYFVRIYVHRASGWLMLSDRTVRSESSWGGNKD